jgi:hypothetical protein
MKALFNKKGWTGNEVGRLMIADLVTAYKNALHGTEKGLLSDSDKAMLVNNLEKKADIRTYNEYKYVHDFVVTVPMRYMVSQNMAEAAFWKLYHLLTSVRQAEWKNQSSRFEPRIMTQAEYDESKKADFAEKMSRRISVERLVIHAIEYHIARYNQCEKTPYDTLFEAAKSASVTNRRILDAYDPCAAENDRPRAGDRSAAGNPFVASEAASVDQIVAAVRARREKADKSERAEESQAPGTITLFAILECAAGFYDSAETGEETTFFELMKDAPDLYQAIWKDLTETKPLAFIQNTPRADIVGDAERIGYQLLYDNDILDYRAMADDFAPDGCACVAVLKNGRYQKQDSAMFQAFRAEKLVGNYAAHVSECIETIVRQYKEMYAYHVFLAISGEFCDVEELEILISPINEDLIEALNDTFALSDEIACAQGRNARQRDQLIQSVKALLVPISVSALQPTEETVHAAKANMTFKTFQGYAAEFINQYLIAAEEGKP